NRSGHSKKPSMRLASFHSLRSGDGWNAIHCFFSCSSYTAIPQCFPFSYPPSVGSRPACFTTGFFSYSFHVRPLSVLYAMHSPRPVLVYASTRGGFSFVPPPDVLRLFTTAL